MFRSKLLMRWCTLSDNLFEIAPVDFAYNVANGFHNIPKYFFDDETVRTRKPIVGIKTGFQAAGKVAV